MKKNIYRIIISMALLVLLSQNWHFPSTIFAKEGDPAERKMIPASQAALTIDGVLEDRLWETLPVMKLEPARPGVPEQLAAEIRLALRGGYLCLAAFCPEPGGKVLAKSIGYNPAWEKDAYGSPELEDRLICRFLFDTDSGKESELEMEVNPWGALRLERDNVPVPSTWILARAQVTVKGWNIETAVPLAELNLDKSASVINISIIRVRSRRALAPEFRWKLPGRGDYVQFLLPAQLDLKKNVSAPLFSPSRSGDTGPAFQVGRVQVVPPLDLEWNDPFWQKIPGFSLMRNDPVPREPSYHTEIKWLHDNRTLAVIFRCVEDERVDCDTGERDGNIGGDDHVFIYLAATGSSLVEIMVNPAGAVRDGKATGPHMSGASSGAWNGNIETYGVIKDDAWTVRINLPLAEIAQALGELEIPVTWRVLIGRVRQDRIGVPAEISSLPVIGNPYFIAPARYRDLRLTDLDPAGIIPPEPGYRKSGEGGLAVELAGLDTHALSRLQRSYYDLSSMLENSIRERIRSLALEENREWESVHTLVDWERFRDKRIKALKASLGDFPEKGVPLLYQVTGTYQGDGYQVRNIVYQSRPGLFVAANLYLPLDPPAKMPGIIIIPSHHYPKTQGELKDCGMIWARTGCAVLVMDRLGCGERIETIPWYRQAYQSEYLIEMQLGLIGQNRQGWMAWDAVRAVDLFYELGNIDPERIILIGSVAGGGVAAAIAGILDERLDAVIPFNFGRVFWDGWAIKGSLSNKITPWFIYNAAAPKKFIYAHEFSWEGEEGPEYPSVWVPAWPRYKKVYGLYTAMDNLAATQGTGLLRVQETAGDCWSIGPVQRQPIYHVLRKWFGIPLPSRKDQEIKIDSELSFARLRPDYAALKLEESMRRMPDSILLSITPEASARLNRKALHRIALEEGRALLQKAREKRSDLDFSAGSEDLTAGLSSVLGDIEPDKNAAEAESLWSEKLSSATAEAFILRPEPGILIPLFLLKPAAENENSFPLVIALSEGGKDSFLKDRSKEIERLLLSGIAVCIPEVRGTGETAPGQYNRNEYPATRIVELGNTLLGLRLKDLRTVLAWAGKRKDIDCQRMALWGDSFAPVNPENLWVDELMGWPVSPQIQYLASPLGAHLALFAALYHKEIKAVAARGGLVGYLSILEHNFSYVPPDMAVPEILRVGDISDICAHIAPRPVLLEGTVDGRNCLVDSVKLNQEINLAAGEYKNAGFPLNLILRKDTARPDMISWLISQLRKTE